MPQKVAIMNWFVRRKGKKKSVRILPELARNIPKTMVLISVYQHIERSVQSAE